MPYRRPAHPLRPLVLVLAGMAGYPVLAVEPVSTTVPAITVIGLTPLPGLELPSAMIAAPVQSVSDLQLQESQALDVSAYLNRHLGGVHVNETQGNPFQMDVNYRGYTASPLLGTPQGLSVYFDGVRVNQPFGDVVSWDLIPRSAIASMNLMPGSNPLFGLNTLGGALAIQTKEGRTHAGTSMQAIVGSYGRRSVEFEHGGFNEKGLEWFFTAHRFHENGWRTNSPSDIRQVFGKVGWQDARTDLDLTVAYADNRMNGNGLQDVRLLEQDYRSIYTQPDTTKNRNFFLNLTGRHSLSDTALVSGNMYYRSITSTTYNGDLNEAALEGNPYLPGENTSNSPFPYLSCLAHAAGKDEPNETCTGLINRSRTMQENFGLAGQLSLSPDLGGRRNLLILGAGYDQSNLHFKQSGQYGYIHPDRSVIPVEAWADGSQAAGPGEEALDSRVNLKGRTQTVSLFATDTLSLTPYWHATLSGRYNRTQVKNLDQINPGGGADSLDGDHSFQRFNPAFGITFTPNRMWNAYAGYSQGSRTPTSIELGCANPENPCKLPNAMAGDPPLRQVVTKTWDLGLRGQHGATRWNLGVFRADNHDDILFVADDRLGYGYFKNFGKTRRQGLEAGASSVWGPISLAFHYTLLDATYRSPEEVGGAGNSTNEEGPGLEGTINVRKGNRIPLVPRHILKASAGYRVTEVLSLGTDLIGVSGAYARGNENNQHQPDGAYYLGSGRSGGYTVVNLNARYQATRQLQVFGTINNLFDRAYSTGAQLGATAFSASGHVQTRPFGSLGGEYPQQGSTFLAPGAPRTLWIGVRYSL
ncbi:TonB-dependent receptor [Zoogloea sp.]|uniref:TonB-dependent receptor n=1 Tax=Zoogloea sp. TaxID=49181 RepID=UPI0026030B61|nr:TonB-dependent receptor [Zoogloea sp.]MDD3354460.1 TonB-dependent receptor [Zoogloea sp.]